MHQRTPRNFAYGLSRWLSGGAIFLILVLGASLKTDPGQYPPVLSDIIRFVHSEAWWIIMALAAIGGATKVIHYILGPPWVWRNIEAMLDELRDRAFYIRSGDAHHHHRVTLFKRVGFRLRVWPSRRRYWRWGKGNSPFSGWLIPVARSGHTTQRTNSVFLASDECPDKAEGVAGKTWITDEMLYIDSLPDLDDAADTSIIDDYARRTWVTRDVIHQRIVAGRSMARCYCGVPIEIKGKPWGVLVLDSRRSKGIKKPTRANLSIYTFRAKYLGRLLERA